MHRQHAAAVGSDRQTWASSVATTGSWLIDDYRSWTGHRFISVSPQLRISPDVDTRMTMTRTLAAAVIFVALGPSAAFAQHRGGDAALGALSGAVVLGPVGAVAGAVVGYTAGPAIARSWGFRGARSERDRRYKVKNAAAPAGGAAAGATRESKVGAAPMESNARLSSAPVNVTSSTPTAQPQPASGTLPPVQALE
jgi:hypothetical protein